MYNLYRFLEHNTKYVVKVQQNWKNEDNFLEIARHDEPVSLKKICEFDKIIIAKISLVRGKG